MRKKNNSFTESDIHSIRVMDKSYGVEQLNDLIKNHIFSPSTIDRNLFIILLVGIFFALSKLGYDLGGATSFAISVAIFEVGRILTMKLVGWSNIQISHVLLIPISWADENISASRKAIALNPDFRTTGLSGICVLKMVRKDA